MSEIIWYGLDQNPLRISTYASEHRFWAEKVHFCSKYSQQNYLSSDSLSWWWFPFHFSFLINSFSFSLGPDKFLLNLYSSLSTLRSPKESRAYTSLLLELLQDNKDFLSQLQSSLTKHCFGISTKFFSHSYLAQLTLFNWLCLCLQNSNENQSQSQTPRTLTDLSLRLCHILSGEHRQTYAKRIYATIYHSLTRTLISVCIFILLIFNQNTFPIFFIFVYLF